MGWLTRHVLSAFRIVRLAAILCLLAWSPPARAAATLDAGEDTPDGFGGGEFVFRDVEHLTEKQRREIQAIIDSNLRMLEREGKLPPRIEANPLLRWPLRPAIGLADPGYHGISNFVDQNLAFPNQLLDYNCGIRTYDTSSGYNHQGIDFFLWPFSWLKMDTSQVEVVAAAPGTIVNRSDGNFDRNCAFNNGTWNAVYIAHADGSVAWYGHLKNGSATPKTVGQTVAQGEYLGVVGSSGNSTGPHLHLEVYDSTSALNEPYQGPCNAMNANSWWESQRPYYDSAVNRVATNSAPPTFPACPTAESPNESNSFVFGATAYFVTYYRDQLMSQTSQYRIRRPDSTVYSSWSHNSPEPHYAASYWYWFFNGFAPAGPAGTWRFEVTFNGQTTTHDFFVRSPNASGRVPDRPGMPTPPLTLSPATGNDITLTWGGSCIPSDTDYEVYEGTLGSFYSHTAKLCSTGGLTSVTLTPAAGNTYYVVVPANAVREGSYGLSSSAVERPVGISACRPQEIGGCP